MNTLNPSNLFRGEKIRLTSDSPEQTAATWVKWQRDSELKRLLNEEPAALYSRKNLQDFYEKQSENIPTNSFLFQIHTLVDDRQVGQIRMWLPHGWPNAEAWVGMAIGDRQDWNKGYGSDALRLVLHYAFDELNLHRVTLSVFEYNPRGIHTYEKLGFRLEGVERGVVLREGRRFDSYVMGVLRTEWQR